MSQEERIEAVRSRLLAWVREGNLREFPWRSTTAPYEILVAQVLLQQTQAEQVEPVYQEFLETYPTLEELARADVDEVTALIEELGLHNTRGKALVRIAEELAGRGVPADRAKLEELPHVSHYGSNAVLCFAFGEDRPIVDANVIRIYERIFGREFDPNKRETWEFAAEVLPAENVREFNLALLDFGAAICRPTPKCEECFLTDRCTYYAAVRSD